ncbi:MAG: ISNCY family transposase [Nitrospinae bacterium]|nr:ISNCY family transposase [Nitrospinota bacterium]
MARKDIIMLTPKELKRLHVVKKVFEGVIKQVEASELLSLSDRQIRRLINRVKIEGDIGIAHKSRGKPSGRKLPKNIRDKVITLYRERFEGFGPTLAAEKLQELEGIRISDETLQLWLIEEGDWKKVRKGRKHRQWRERKHYFGEMVQMDGSHHDWFEGRGPECVLMGYIDDATGKVYGGFYEYEGTIPAMDSFKRYIRKYGIPVGVYFDKHTTYKSPSKLSVEDEINGTKPLSEFERALKELGVDVKHAHSPQAKGRIERLFRTFQDRVVKEMRLRGIKTIDEANKFLQEYLPEYNRKFAVKPKKEDNLHREIPKGLNLDGILCIKTERALRNDFTISHNGRLYQILDKTSAKRIQVEERVNGTMVITHNDTCLRYKEITERPERQQKKPIIFILRKKTGYIPPANHPWRRYKPVIQNNNYQQIEPALTQT